MNRAQLRVGDKVLVRLPFDAGTGWATVIGFEPHGVRVHFDTGQGPGLRGDREILLRNVVRKAGQA